MNKREREREIRKKAKETPGQNPFDGPNLSGRRGCSNIRPTSPLDGIHNRHPSLSLQSESAFNYLRQHAQKSHQPQQQQ